MPAPRSIVGLDIGGANIKASDGEACSFSQPFPLWREPARLAAAIAGVLERFPPPKRLAVTMTGELADCFSTKADGVRHILAAVESVARGVEIAVWQTGGEFVSPAQARELAPLVAAANWHALATWAARSIPTGAGLLLDVGSTTTDIIPLCDGVPATDGRTDVERLLSHELVYTGVRRTPICAVAPTVPLRGRACPLAAELFATMLDVYLILDEIAEDDQDLNTANNRPATKTCAYDRLARMLCADVTELTVGELTAIALAIAAHQRKQLATAVASVLARRETPCELVLSSGEGAFLAERVAAECRELAGIQIISLSETLGPEHSLAACAYGLARLARESAF